MISDVMKDTMEKLNDVRAKRPKFVCVNDDMDDPSPELLRALQEFYQSFFPFPSRFELPRGQQTNPPPLQYTVLRPKARCCCCRCFGCFVILLLLLSSSSSSSQ